MPVRRDLCERPVHTKCRTGSALEIYETLTKQRFYDWYNKDFAAHIQGEDGCKTEEKILEDIYRLFLSNSR